MDDTPSVGGPTSDEERWNEIHRLARELRPTEASRTVQHLAQDALGWARVEQAARDFAAVASPYFHHGDGVGGRVLQLVELELNKAVSR